MDKRFINKFFKELKEIMYSNKNYLIELDGVVGDSDLGLTMSDGFAAAYNTIEKSDEADIGVLVYKAGKSMSTAVPSTMGTLMASGLMQVGKELKGKAELSNNDIVTFFEAFFLGIQKRGKAKVGEKTVLDGLDPAIKALKETLNSGGSISKAAIKAREGAEEGLKNTTTMVAVHGRAATRGEASRSLEDPGAAVAVLIMKAFEKTINYDTLFT